MLKSRLMVLGVVMTFTHMAQANPKLFEFGKQACHGVFAGQYAEFNAAQYRSNIKEDGLSEEAFCRCTGERFVNNMPYQSQQMAAATNARQEAKIMEDMLRVNMAGCFASNGG